MRALAAPRFRKIKVGFSLSAPALPHADISSSAIVREMCHWPPVLRKI
ncbi:hypothetical protein [Thioclava dalianensis]|nr:hypothetical protein [Thioclava dalianensis]